LKRHLLVTLEITSKDRAYPWVLQWLYRKQRNNPIGKPQHISVETTMKASSLQNAQVDALKTVSSMESTVKIDFVPSPGRHLLVYEGQYLMVQRIREQSMMDLNTGKPWEKIQLTAFGRNTVIFQQILADALEMAMKQEEGKTIIFTNWGAEWRQFGAARSKRSLDSVILDSGVSEKVVSDVNDWLRSQEWYASRGIPYRRGYLLHGPPGGGKSSFIMALAGKLGYNICILNLAERGLTDDRLALALSSIPPQSLVLLEDIDAAFPNRDAQSRGGTGSGGWEPESRSSDVTFSGLLNVLDGVASSEERLVFMTTNYVDRLDAALIRPGRVDVVQLIDNASDFQVMELFRRFFPDTSDELAGEFLKCLREVHPVMSMAALQGHLLTHKNSPEKSIESLKEELLTYKTSKQHSEISSKSIPTVPSSQRVVRMTGKRVLTADQVDRMYFNPQPGWDKDIQQCK